MSLAEYRARLTEKPRAASGRGDEEHEAQRRFFLLVDHLAEQFPDRTDELLDVWAVPNGGHRQRRTAARMKAEGVRRGVLDIECWVPRDRFHGLAIEMKSGVGRPSPEQAKRLVRLRLRGYRCELCRTWVEAARVLCEYLGIEFEARWIVQVELAAVRKKRKRKRRSTCASRQ